MAKPFHVEIVTPDRVVFAGEITHIALPGADGSFGVLANHHPLIASLDVGEVRLSTEEGRERSLAISGGFFEVSANKAIVLADSAEWAEEIDIQRAQSAAHRARERIFAMTAGIDRERARLAQTRAKVRLAVAERSGNNHGLVKKESR